MRDILIQGEAVLRCTQREDGDARAGAERAEGALWSVWTELAKELEEAKRQTVAKLERARVAEEKLDAAKATISAWDLCIDAFTIEVKAAKQRAYDAEEIARMANTRAAEREAVARTAKERAAVAEERAAAAEERVAAVERRSVKVHYKKNDFCLRFFS